VHNYVDVLGNVNMMSFAANEKVEESMLIEEDKKKHEFLEKEEKEKV